MSNNQRKLIVTHHAPDLDAIGSVWLLKRFDTQKYGTAKIAFVDPGKTISLEEAEQDYNCQLHQVTHVDTGLGEFDHHQPEKASKDICAATLVYDYLCEKYPNLLNDMALKEIINYIVQVDHFGEIYWPESKETRFVFSIQELIRGHEHTDPHDDDSQLHFGMEALDYAYAAMVQRLKAEEIIETKSIIFPIKNAECLAVETRNDEVLKLSQLKGYAMAIRKDSEYGHIRIKVRPDADFNLDQLNEEIKKIDQTGTWFYHASGKMLLNGSIKNRNQKASPLSLEQVIELVKKIYG